MKKGFTLVELVIVIIIVGILAIVAVPIYKGYTNRAKETEAKALLGAINTAEKVYFAENGTFVNVALTTFSAVLGVDTTGNKYYTKFQVTGANGTDFTAEIPAEGLSATATSAGLKAIRLVGNASTGATITGGVAEETGSAL